MRDLERLHDIVEYRVSPGQIRLAFLGVLAVACAIFAVGVSVGKRIDPTTLAMAVDPLAELDRVTTPSTSENASATAEEDDDEAPRLTYHDELTSRTATALRAPEKRVQTEQVTRPAAQPRPETATQPAKQASPLSPPSGSRVQDEPARPERPQPGESSVFTLQVASFETREEAQAFAADLRTRGHTVFLVRTSTPERGTWFRVRVGPFHSRREAVRYQVRFERRERLPTFLVQRRR